MTSSPCWLKTWIAESTIARPPVEVGRTPVTVDDGVNGVAHPHRRMDFLGQFQHGQPSALNQGLQDEAFNQRVGQRSRDRSAGNAAMQRGRIDKHNLDHAGDTDETHQVGLGHGTAKGLETLADAQVLPVKALAQLLDVVGGTHDDLGSLPGTGFMPISASNSAVCSPRRGAILTGGRT